MALSRRACPACEVLINAEPPDRCWCCNGPLIPVHHFINPASSAALASWRNQQETPQ